MDKTKTQCLRHSVCVCIYLLCFSPPVSGFSLHLSGYSSYAVLNQPFTFTCTVTQAENLNDLVRFFKTTHTTFASLYQSTSKCSVFNPASKREGYYVSCGSGTSSSSSSTKNYTLTINTALDYNTTYDGNKIRSSDATNWWCDLNSANQHSNTVNLQFSKGPGSINFNPTSPVTIREGRTLSVRCSAGCTPTCSYSWKEGNTEIISDSLLTQENIRRDQTQFTCTTTNTFTSVSQSKQLTLNIHYPPSEAPSFSGTRFPINEDDTVSLHCSTSGGNPKPTLSWSCPGVGRYGSCSDRGDTRTCTISFTANRNQNNKNCVCTPVWLYSEYTQTTSTQIIVHYQASIKSMTLNSHSSSVTVAELTRVTLSCDVDSNPASHIKLYNNSHILTDVDNSKTAEYTWNEAGCLDTGRYTCEADNNIKSTVNQSVQLIVMCSPRLDDRVTFQDTFSVSMGDRVTLSISVIVNPAPTFTWYRITDKTNLGTSDPVSSTDVSALGNLTIANIQEKDFGTYQVVVTNSDSGSNLVKNFTVVDRGPPSIPSDVIVCSSCSSSISVAWLEEFNGGLSQTFLVQYRAGETRTWRNVTKALPEIHLHKIHTAKISNLQPNTKYLVRVLAYNSEGNKGFTAEQETLTDESTYEKCSSLGVGAGIGIGIGILLVIVLLVAGLVFTYSRMKTAKSTAEKTYDSRQFQAEVQESNLYDDLGQTQGNEGNVSTNVSTNVSDSYSTLETRKDTPYEVLAVYENSQIKQDSI